MTEKLKQRRFDPGRRNHIIEVTLEVIAKYGVAGTSHRIIAKAADIPLGSMTYHFNGMEELLNEVFSNFAEEAASYLRQKMGKARSAGEALDILVEVATDNIWASPKNMAVLYEFYSSAVRNPTLRPVLHRWNQATQDCLQQHFTIKAARTIHTALEGILLQRYLDPKDAMSVEEIRLMFLGILNTCKEKTTLTEAVHRSVFNSHV